MSLSHFALFRGLLSMTIPMTTLGRALRPPTWNTMAMTRPVKTHLEECTTRYLAFKCFLFSVYRVYPEVEDGRGTLDLACAFAVLFGVGKPGSVLLTAEVVW